MRKHRPETKPIGENNMRSIPFKIPRSLIWVVVGIIAIAVLASIVRSFWYFEVIYNDDASLQQRMTAFTLQAMKVCVGDKKFDEAVIGSGRDALRSCIDDELSGLAQPLGLEVRNVAVPQVTISLAVQTALDAIVQSRLLTEK